MRSYIDWRVLARMLGPEGVDCEIPRRLESASEDASPRREVDCEIPHRLESTDEDIGPQREVDCEIPPWLERKHSL